MYDTYTGIIRGPTPRVQSLDRYGYRGREIYWEIRRSVMDNVRTESLGCDLKQYTRCRASAYWVS